MRSARASCPRLAAIRLVGWILMTSRSMDRIVMDSGECLVYIGSLAGGVECGGGLT